jgi:hypothetical protein
MKIHVVTTHSSYNWPFSGRPKSANFRVLSALVKDPRQFKQREKRLLKVGIANLPLYKQL